VILSHPSTQTVTVDYDTIGGSATEDTDYPDTNGTLTFVPLDTGEQISVTTTEDSMYELDETFTVQLSNGSNGNV
jgi:hypothetical protein